LDLDYDILNVFEGKSFIGQRTLDRLAVNAGLKTAT